MARTVATLCLTKSKELGINHCKLPLHRVKDFEGRHCLNIDAVFKMLLRFQDQEEKWDDIMDEEMPNRNRQSKKTKNQRRRKAAAQAKQTKNENKIESTHDTQKKVETMKTPMFVPRSLHSKQAK